MKFEFKGNWYRIWFSEKEYDYLDVCAEYPSLALKYAKVREPYLRIEKLEVPGYEFR